MGGYRWVWSGWRWRWRIFGPVYGRGIEEHVLVQKVKEGRRMACAVRVYDENRTQHKKGAASNVCRALKKSKYIYKIESIYYTLYFLRPYS